MYKEYYPCYAACGEAGVLRKMEVLRQLYPYAKISYEVGEIPQWGSGIETSPNYRKTEMGFMVTVEHPNRDEDGHLPPEVIEMWRASN